MRSDLPPLTQGDEGQMMLLAAVVLVVAFLSLSVMVGRIATIEPQTLRDTDPVLLEEAEALRRGACAAMQVGATNAAAIRAGLDFIELQSAGRGFLADLEYDGTSTTATAVLSHQGSTVEFAVAKAAC